MTSFAIGLLLASGATAQQVIGTWMVTPSSSAASSSAASSSASGSSAYGSSAYGSSASSAASSAAYGSSSASPASSYGGSSAQYTGSASPSYSANPSQYTAPPAWSSSMGPSYYTQFTGGGYSSMNCGYGYSKGSDGKCQVESWVRPCTTALYAFNAHLAHSVLYPGMGLL